MHYCADFGTTDRDRLEMQRIVGELFVARRAFQCAPVYDGPEGAFSGFRLTWQAPKPGASA